MSSKQKYLRASNYTLNFIPSCAEQINYAEIDLKKGEEAAPHFLLSEKISWISLPENDFCHAQSFKG